MDYAQILMKSAGKSDYRESSLQTLMKVNDLKKTINKDGRANIIRKEPYANKIETYLSNEELKRKMNEGSRQYLKGVYQYYGDLGLENLGVTNKTSDQQEYIKLARKQTQYQKLLNNPNQLEYLSKVDPLGLFTLQQLEQKNVQDLQSATADPNGERLYNLLRGNRVQAVGQPTVDAIGHLSDSDSFSLPPRNTPSLVQLSDNARGALARFTDSSPGGQPSEAGLSYNPILQSRAPSEASGETIDLGDVHPQDRELVQDVQNQVADENEQLAQPQVEQIAQQAYQNALAEANGAPVAGQEQVPAQAPEQEQAQADALDVVQGVTQDLSRYSLQGPQLTEAVLNLERKKPEPPEYLPTPFETIPSSRVLNSLNENSLKRLAYQFNVPFNDSDTESELRRKLKGEKPSLLLVSEQFETEAREQRELKQARVKRERERAEKAAKDEENIRRFGLKEVEYSKDDDDDTVYAKAMHNTHMRSLVRVAKGENLTKEDIAALFQAPAAQAQAPAEAPAQAPAQAPNRIVSESTFKVYTPKDIKQLFIDNGINTKKFNFKDNQAMLLKANKYGLIKQKSGKGFKPLSSFPPHIVGGLLRKHINRLIPKAINRNEYNRENAHKLLNSILKNK